MRQANTTFVNLRAALDDLEPLVNTAKPATKNLAPFLAELRPVLSKFMPFLGNLRLAVARPGKANDAAELLAVLPTVQERASKAFPHSEEAIAAFQPNLNFARAYVPDIFNGLGKLGAAAGYYDGNGHYLRAATSAQNLFKYNARRPWNRSRRRSSTTSSAPRPASTAAARAAPPRKPPTAPTPSSTRPGAAAASTPPNATRPTCPPDHDQAPDNRGSAGRGRRRGRPPRLRRRQQQRLPGPRRLRQRRLHGPGRAGPGRRRQRRHDRIGRRLDAGRDGRLPRRQAGLRARQGDHRHGHHRPRLPGLPQRRQLPDPPAVADRREVRRLPPDPAASAGLARRRRR